MKKGNTWLLILSAIALVVLTICGCMLAWQKTDEVPADDGEEVFSLKLSEIQDDANNSSSMWELMCRMFPDHIIFKDSKGRFTSEKVNSELALNTYDWSSLAGTRKGMDVSYYQGAIDLGLIEKGEHYSKLKKSVIIFICTEDPFDCGLSRYTFIRVCRERP